MSAEETPIEINVQQVKGKLDQGEDFLLLDCREQAEYNTAKIDAATLIPMAEIQYRLQDLEQWREKEIVVHCHLGGRSLRVTQYLREMGFDKTQNMTGGIEAWSVEVDPSVPRYS